MPSTSASLYLEGRRHNLPLTTKSLCKQQLDVQLLPKMVVEGGGNSRRANTSTGCVLAGNTFVATSLASPLWKNKSRHDCSPCHKKLYMHLPCKSSRTRKGTPLVACTDIIKGAERMVPPPWMVELCQDHAVQLLNVSTQGNSR